MMNTQVLTYIYILIMKGKAYENQGTPLISISVRLSRKENNILIDLPLWDLLMTNGELKKVFLSDSSLNLFEKIYVLFFGIPIIGYRIRSRYILPILAEFKDYKILDAGCGRGFFSAALAMGDKNNDILALDIDEQVINRNTSVFNRLAIHNVKFEKKDLFDLNNRDHFDFIVSTHNLEHVERDDELLRIFHCNLKTGGRILIQVPSPPEKYYFKSRLLREFPGHVRQGYTLEQLSDKLERASFRILSCKKTGNAGQQFICQLGVIITRCEEKNKLIYALVFPFLLFASFLFYHFGRKDGGQLGLLCMAQKE